MRKNATPDQIHIESLEIVTFIGVPDEERAQPQRLTVSLTFELNVGFQGLNDRFENTVDYAAVCEAVKKVAAARPRKLVETLAEEIATTVLAQFPIWRLSLELRKYILPDTQYIAVRIERPAP